MDSKFNRNFRIQKMKVELMLLRQDIQHWKSVAKDSDDPKKRAKAAERLKKKQAEVKDVEEKIKVQETRLEAEKSPYIPS